MGGIRTPRSVKGAQALCERFAEIEAECEAAENARNEAIARANAAADALIEPLLAERGQIAEKLEPWWQADGETLTEGKRKTIELGGCTIGTATGKASLDVPAKAAADEARAALGRTKWGKELLRVTVGFDKRALAKAMEGDRADELGRLGFVLVPAPELFVLKRAEQQGTRR